MKIIPLETLCKTDYRVAFLDSVELPQNPENPAYSCISTPKKQNMLLFLNGAETQYKLKDGTLVNTHASNVVYVPIGSEYTVRCTKSEHEKSSSFQINFLLFDANGDACRLSNIPLIFSPKNADIKTLFEKEELLSADANSLPTDQKCVVYDILNCLAKDCACEKSFKIIEAGVEYLHAHYQEDFPLSHLAKLCHVSEEYFRKLFKKQTGKQPAKYRNELRLQKAELYLLHSDLSVNEISETLGYFTVAHFIKQFREYHGIPPLAYRKKYQ